MRRLPSPPRPHWQQLVESQGMYFHSPGNVPYWDESAYYEFSPGEVDELERATNWLNEACLKAVEHVIDNDRFSQVGVPPTFVDLARQSWEHDEFTVYGRFDFRYDGHGPPVLLEYNADTPTALLEAAVIQWHWLKDRFPGEDQFNSIHERLVEAWKRIRNAWGGEMVFTALAGNLEDYMTVNYLRDTAMQAGWPTQYLDVEAIGFHHQRRLFVDRNDRPLRNVFKLYPWEWMLRDRFAPHLLEHRLHWLEAPWKMLLSNKAILVILHELFPDSPYLLRTAFEPLDVDYVKKPLHGREGANIEAVRGGQTVLQTGGPYGGPFVYQEARPLPNFDGNYPVLGSWLVNGYACGVGIREDRTPVTTNTSRFVPHLIRSRPQDAGAPIE